MTLDEFLRSQKGAQALRQPEMDVLRDEGALAEAQLVAFKVDSVRNSAYLLFDLRNALQLREANTAVVVVREVNELSWEAEPRQSRTAWNVISSAPSSVDSLWTLKLGFYPSASLAVSGRGADFYVGQILAIRDAPPDYLGADEALLDENTQSWVSSFEPKSGSTFQPIAN